MKGVYDESFIGDTQHSTATHIKTTRGHGSDITDIVNERRQLLGQLRKDIKRFKSANRLTSDHAQVPCV